MKPDITIRPTGTRLFGVRLVAAAFVMGALAGATLSALFDLPPHVGSATGGGP